jgi:hypothetical protein
MDVTSLDALADILHTLRDRNVDLYLVRVMSLVRRALKRSGLMEEIGEDHLWHSISQGVRQARRTHRLDDYPAIPGGVFDSDWIAGLVTESEEQTATGRAAQEAEEERIVPRRPDSEQNTD